MDTSSPHIFDYHGTKVHVVVINDLVCIDPKDTLKCLGFDNVDGTPEEMLEKLVSLKGTYKGLAFAHWIQKVVYPAMEK